MVVSGHEFSTVIFSLSVGAGLDKGIKRLSDVNAVLAIVLLGSSEARNPQRGGAGRETDNLVKDRPIETLEAGQVRVVRVAA